MKKMMIIGVALLSAAVMQAGTINWGNSSTSYIKGLDGVTAINQTTAGTINLLVQLIDITDNNMVEVGNLGTSAMSNMTAGQLSGVALTYTYGTTQTSIGNADQMMVKLFATFGTQAYVMSVFSSGTTPWGVTATDNSKTESFTWATGTYGGVGTAGAVDKWVAVPEPCTMALVGLGIAVVGLRRKFRKA